jgi:HK97 gp10 family phage protein
VGFETSGIRQLQADLGKLAARAVPTASRAVAKTAHDIEATAKRLAPVDTGNLRNSISSDIGVLSAEIGPTAEYGGYVEEGTSRMAPQPYMGPAADQHFPELDKALDALVTGS